MRYPQGDGLTDERRAFRQGIRLQAAELFIVGHSSAEIARRLRVSVRSVQRWRRAWQQQGESGLHSRGSPGRPIVSDALFAKLEHELLKGPVAHGWSDQTWTLARIKTVIGRRFHKTMTLSGIAQMLHCHGWSHQTPARRAAERDPQQISGWARRPGRRRKRRGGARSLAGLRRRSRILDDAADPPHLGRRGHTPVVTTRARARGRISIAALACYRPGHRSRLIWRPGIHTATKRTATTAGHRRSFTWRDYRDLLICAHAQLDGPIVLIWDNLSVHRDRRLRAFIDGSDWLQVFYLPPYAPDLNPVEGIWSLLRRSSHVNTTFTDLDRLMRTLRHGLRKIQYRSDLIDACLAATGLTLAGSGRSTAEGGCGRR